MGAQADQIIPIFFGVWIVLGVSSAGFFFLNNNAALKRKVWPPFVIGVGILFFCFVALMGFPLGVLFFAALAIAFATFLNLRNTKFCDACGKTLMNQNLLTRPSFCSRCGAPLEDADT